MEKPGAHASEWASTELERVLDLDCLSPAERRVLELALDGRSVRGIAEALVVGESTVHSHLLRIYRKLGVRGRLDLLARVSQARSPSVGPPVSPTRPSHDDLIPALAAAVAVMAVLVGFVVPASTFASSPALLVSGLYLRRSRRGSIRAAGRALVIAGVVLLLVVLMLSVAIRAG